MNSYSKPLIRFVLINYADLSGGLSPRIFDGMKQFTSSVGTKNPQETLTIWKADIDRSLSSLATKRGDIWDLVSLGITPAMLLHVANHPQLSRMQRQIVSICMLEPCCTGRPLGYCVNHGIIRRMQDFLNGKITSEDAK
jgi:hypothetical protein